MKKRLFILSLVMMLTFTFTGCEIGTSVSSEKDSTEAPKKTEFADAADHITYAQLNAFKLKGMGVDVNAYVEGDLTPYLEDTMGNDKNNQKYNHFLNEFLQNAKLNYGIKYQKDEQGKMPKFEIAYGIHYKDSSLIDILASLDDELAGISAPAVSEKGFALNYKQFLQAQDADSAKVMEAILSLDLEKYIDILLGDKTTYEFYNEDLTSIKNVYAKYLNENATKTDTTSIERDGKEITITEYKLAYDYDKTIALNIEILEAIKKDDTLRNLIFERADLILDEIIKSKDYELFDAKEEDIKQAKEELAKAKTDEELKKQWEESIDQFVEMYKKQQAMFAAPEFKGYIDKAEIEYLIRINEDNILDSALMTATLKDENEENPIKIVIDIVNLNPDEMTFVDTSKFLDMTAYIDADYEAKSQYFVENEEAYNYVKDYLLEAVDYVLKSDNFKQIYDLMDKHKMQLEKGMMQSQLEQIKMMIENMTPEMMSMM